LAWVPFFLFIAAQKDLNRLYLQYNVKTTVGIMLGTLGLAVDSYFEKKWKTDAPN